ncbi:hypothetical protein PC112_g7399 [Phytophthora cactorum]|nr:hypothetical protein PC112_g7399 [Phytophthora cactorum]
MSDGEGLRSPKPSRRTRRKKTHRLQLSSATQPAIYAFSEDDATGFSDSTYEFEMPSTSDSAGPASWAPDLIVSAAAGTVSTTVDASGATVQKTSIATPWSLQLEPEEVYIRGERDTHSRELRQFLGLATYLCKYVENYAGKIRPLSQLLKKEAEWKWTDECQQAFDAVKQGLTEAPILAVADQDRPFYVVCDASDFAIGCALMQHDNEGRDRVVYYQSCQMKPTERNYPIYDKDLLAMNGPFVVYTDHASPRTAVKSPHISQRIARWLALFAEYDFRVEYKLGRLNVVADALSRQPDYAVKTADANPIGVERVSAPSLSLIDDVKAAYASDADAKQLLSYASAPSDEARRKLAPHLRARAHRYRVHEVLLLCSAVDDDVIRIGVPNDYDLRMRIMYEYHGAPTAGHPGREKTYMLLTRDFYLNHQYKWVRKYVRAYKVCQRVKPAAFSQAPLQSLPTPSECWLSISMNFVVGLPPDIKWRTGVVGFVDRFSKMVHLAAVPAEVTAVTGLHTSGYT